jgi:hypothetical protein
VLPARPVAVVVLRRPAEIAFSLRRRDAIPLRAGLALWERHMRHLLTGVAGLPTLVTRYDDLLSDPAAWCTRLAAPVLGQLGVATSGDLDQVVTAVHLSHRHHDAGPTEKTLLAAEQIDLEATSPRWTCPANAPPQPRWWRR